MSRSLLVRLLTAFRWLLNCRSRRFARVYWRASPMTANEQEFHSRLRAALPPPAWELWPQVSMLALIKTRRQPGGRMSIGAGFQRRSTR